MKTNSTTLKKRFDNLKLDIIELINDLLIKKGIEEITFTDSVVINYIDDQSNEVIKGYNVQTGIVETDLNSDTSNYYKINELGTDYLLWMVEEIEDDNFEVEE